VLSVLLLGPVELRRDGEPVPVPSGRPTELLARLALDAGTAVRSDRLIDDLWGDDAPATARNTLQSKVSQLRRALGDPDALVGAAGAYTLTIERGSVDALEVEDLVAEVTRRRQADDPAGALEHAERALARYRGEVLAGAGDGAWAAPHRVRYEELRLRLVEDALGARLDLGAGGELVAELEALVDEHPLREGLWSLLITALYRSGRQADALRAASRVRTILVEELGIEPGPVVRALEDQVLQQDPALGQMVASRNHLVATGNLPALTSTLVGREVVLDEVGALVGERRLVTIVGPAGVGKTRLAVEAARGSRLPGGAWLVRLDAADETTALDQLVADALHVLGDAALLERLNGAATLLVLDNCEHLADAAADLTQRVLDAAPDLRVLATSQVPLGLDGECVVALDPLPVDAAVELFTARAGEIRRGFALDDATAPTVEEVCRSLDGLPLAIELAAARVRSLSVHDIAKRLDDRFALLRDPGARRPERRRALAGAIGWSYDLLFPDDQRGLCGLAAFADSASLAGAEHLIEAVGVPRAAALDVLDRLVDRSLVSADDVDGSVRYRLLDSIRAFALQRGAEDGIADRAAAAHADWFAQLADRCDRDVRGTAQAACADAVRAERADVDAALAWCARHDPVLGARIAAGFAWTWVVLGDGVAGARRLRAAIEGAGGAVGPPAAAGAWLVASWLEASAGDVDRAQEDLDRAAVVIAAIDGDPGTLLGADLHRHQAFVRIQQGRPADVVAEAAAGLAGYRPRSLDWGAAGCLLLSAFGRIMQGDTVQAATEAAEAVALLEPIGDAWGSVHAAAMVGAIAEADHDYPRAAAALARAAEASDELGFLGQAALHLTSLGRVQHRDGDDRAAAATLDRAIGAAARAGDLRIAATARVVRARVQRAQGDDDGARADLDDACRWYRGAGGGDGAALAEVLVLALEDGTAPGTDEALRAATADAAGDVEVVVVALDALARRAAERGELDEARRLLVESDGRALGTPVHTADRPDAATARAALARA